MEWSGVVLVVLECRLSIVIELSDTLAEIDFALFCYYFSRLSELGPKNSTRNSLSNFKT